MKNFVVRNEIKMTCVPASKNPNMPDSQDMDHWNCTLSRPVTDVFLSNKTVTMVVPFSTGIGLREWPKGRPGAAAVLNCLANDAASIENASSFEEWAEELGFDPDSRKAGKIYMTCKKQTVELREFLNEGQYHTLLWDTERL